MKRLLLVLCLVSGVLLVPAPAFAVDLDEIVCEDPAGLGGTWVPATNTCEDAFVPDGFDLTVPSGSTLLIDNVGVTNATITNNGTIGDGTVGHAFIGGSLTNNGTINLTSASFRGGSFTNAGAITTNGTLTIDGGASFTNNGTLTVNGQLALVGATITNSSSISAVNLIFDNGTLDNAGTVDFTSRAFVSSGTITNTGTIAGSSLVVDGLTLLDNFGDFTASQVDNSTVINHCGASFSVSGSTAGSTITDLTCSIAVTITPVPTSGDAPLTVDWTVTLTNDGTDDLTAPQVELSADGGTTAFATLVAPPDSGDTADTGVLNAGETWSWTVQTTEAADITVTATGAGTVGPDVITFPDDPDARSSASVTVTTTSSSTSSTTTTAPTTTTTIPEVETDIADSGSTGILAITLAVLGVAALGLATIRSYRSES